MIQVPGFKDRIVAVFGLGQSGMAAARALSESGALVLAWDDSDERRTRAVEAGLVLANFYAREWHDVSMLVLSPGVPLTHPDPHAIVKLARASGVQIIGDIELFQRALSASRAPARFVAVTGTNGKSTTTALIGHMIRCCGQVAAVGGNIGKSVLELEAPRANMVYAIEVSSYQIDLAPSLAPDIGILLNITPDHIDRHGSFDHYSEVKARLFSHLKAGDTAIIGVDDAPSMDICTRISAARASKVVPVSVGKALGRGVYAIDGVLYDSLDAQTVRVGDLKPLKRLAGAHNWQNAAAAYAAGRALGYVRDQILASFESFSGLAHRMEIVAEWGGVTFVNDSKATNADAASKALGAFDNIYWIAGGRAKEGGIASLEAFFPRVRCAYLIGEAAAEFSHTLEGKVAYRQCKTLDAAIAQAQHDAMDASHFDPGVVLLSPACASFDQFENFEQRGDAFRRTVLDLQSSQNQGGAAA